MFSQWAEIWNEELVQKTCEAKPLDGIDAAEGKTLTYSRQKPSKETSGEVAMVSDNAYETEWI